MDNVADRALSSATTEGWGTERDRLGLGLTVALGPARWHASSIAIPAFTPVMLAGVVNAPDVIGLLEGRVETGAVFDNDWYWD